MTKDTLKKRITDCIKKHNAKISYSTVYVRVKYEGMDLEKAVLTPPLKRWERNKKQKKQNVQTVSEIKDKVENHILINRLEMVKCGCGWEGKLCNCVLMLTSSVNYKCPTCGEILKKIEPGIKKNNSTIAELLLKYLEVKMEFKITLNKKLKPEENITLRSQEFYFSERLQTIKRSGNEITLQVPKELVGQKYILKSGAQVIDEGVIAENKEIQSQESTSDKSTADKQIQDKKKK